MVGARSVAPTDEHVIGLENGKVVRTRNVRPKSLQDSGKFYDIDKSKGQPWDPNVTLRMKSWRRKDFQGSKIRRQPKRSTFTRPGRT